MSRQLAPSVQAVIGGESRRPRKAKPAIPPESEAHFQDNYFVPLFTALGWKGYHTHDSRRSPSGFPDWILVRGERWIAAELKRQNGTTTRAQDLWLMACGHAGAETYIWRPSDKQLIAAVLL